MTDGLLDVADVAFAGDGTATARIELDTRRHRFLRDHEVAGSALLSTVMGVEAMACALATCRPDVVPGVVADLVVAPPFLLDGTGTVEVTISAGDEPRCTLRSAAGTHFTAVFGRPGGTQAGVHGSAARAGQDAAPVYDLFFHGPSFRVVGGIHCTAEVAVGRLATGLPPPVEPARPSLMAPLLVEVCLQTAGLWEVAELGAMRIPRGIDRITRLSGADTPWPDSLVAVVRPRADGDGFDAAVLDDRGLPHVLVEGYRTVEFPHPHDPAALARLRGTLRG